MYAWLRWLRVRGEWQLRDWILWIFTIYPMHRIIPRFHANKAVGGFGDQPLLQHFSSFFFFFSVASFGPLSSFRSITLGCFTPQLLRVFHGGKYLNWPIALVRSGVQYVCYKTDTEVQISACWRSFHFSNMRKKRTVCEEILQVARAQQTYYIPRIFIGPTIVKQELRQYPSLTAFVPCYFQLSGGC